MSTRETAGTAFSLFHDLFQRKGLRKGKALWAVSSGRSNLWSHSQAFLLNLKVQILERKLLCQWKSCHRNCLASFLSAPVLFGLPFNCLFIFPKSDGRLCYSPAIGCLRAEPAQSDHSTASVWWIGISPADSKVSISAWVKGDIWWHICQDRPGRDQNRRVGNMSSRVDNYMLLPFFLRQTSVETDCCCKKYI